MKENLLIHFETPIKEAIRIMEESYAFKLCVEDKGIVTKTVLRMIFCGDILVWILASRNPRRNTVSSKRRNHYG